MTAVSDREVLQELIAQPIGGRELMAGYNANSLPHIMSAEAMEAGKRANKFWRPAGKISTATPEAKARDKEMREAQIDLEDAIEAAGGQRGSKVKA